MDRKRINGIGRFFNIEWFNISSMADFLGVSRQTLYNIWEGFNVPNVILAIKIYRLFEHEEKLKYFFRNQECMQHFKNLVRSPAFKCDYSFFSLWS